MLKKEEKMDGDSLRQVAPRLQTLTNYQHRVDGGVLNQKYKLGKIRKCVNLN
ncbi:hypothetical protein [Okeania sp. SIO2C2]|uniref:hypothetical protein n=1 Tax=Okeania sp. SIO2C2 TaxID=2607787 RepID=UPI00257D322E|nr:hypothetical protein [Okeania sp. SIO2C2]